MTSKLDSSVPSAGDRARARAYHRDFWPSMIAYGLVLLVVLRWGGLDGPSPWRFAWALLPVVPTLWTVRAVLRHFRRVDEYERFLLLQGLGAGFAIAMIASLTLGFLGLAGLPVRLGGWVVYGTGMLGWLVTSLVVKR